MFAATTIWYSFSVVIFLTAWRAVIALPQDIYFFFSIFLDYTSFLEFLCISEKKIGKKKKRNIYLEAKL